MKFKLIEKFDETRSMVQEYMYDAIDELNNASLEEYVQWFKSELTCYGDDIEQAVTDAYIEACDYGMIKGVEKTRLTSELKEYIESHTDIIDDTDELMKQCPEHLQHELKIVLSKLDESLNEELLTEKFWFKVTHKNPTKRVKDFYLYSNDATDARSSLKHIYELSKGNHAKQSIDQSVKIDLLSTYPNIKDVSIRSFKSIPSMNILSRTDRSFRRDATDTVNKTTPPIQNIYTHHEDGKEYNQDINNLMIWSNNDKNIAHIAHIVAHDSNNYSASPYNKNIVYTIMILCLKTGFA